MSRWLCFGALLPFCLMGLLGGCGGGDEGPRASISGKVTFDGQPVATGFVNILPADGNGPTQAAPLVDGEYEASGVIPGKKRFLVQSVNEGKFPETTAPPKVTVVEKRIPANAVGNNKEVDVAAGSQTVDLTLSKPTGP